MERWNILALIGFILLLLASVLNLINNTVDKTISLWTFYTYIARTGIIPPLNAEKPIADYWLLSTMILYPFALCLSCISLFRPRIVLLAGIVGVSTWVTYVVAIFLASNTWLASIGPAFYVGIAGALLLVTAYCLRRISVFS